MAAANELVVLGPFAIPFEPQGKGTSKHITKENAKAFWEMDDLGAIGSKQGCYVFALRAGKGFRPWYAGKATKTFKQEALQPGKVQHYNAVIFKEHKGTPVMFFVAKPGRTRKIPKKQIDNLETYLIQSAYYKNKDLKNTQKARVPEWGIKGVVRGGQGRASSNAKRFKSMMGL